MVAALVTSLVQALMMLLVQAAVFALVGDVGDVVVAAVGVWLWQ